jgi:hypothetical protein
MTMTTKTMDKVMQWMTIGGLALALASCSVLAPGMYILIMAALACLGVFGGTIAAFCVMLDAGPFGWIVAGDIAKAGFEIIIAIMQAAASASSGD